MSRDEWGGVVSGRQRETGRKREDRRRTERAEPAKRRRRRRRDQGPIKREVDLISAPNMWWVTDVVPLCPLDACDRVLVGRCLPYRAFSSAKRFPSAWRSPRSTVAGYMMVLPSQTLLRYTVASCRKTLFLRNRVFPQYHNEPWLLLPWRRNQSEAQIKAVANSKCFMTAVEGKTRHFGCC